MVVGVYHGSSVISKVGDVSFLPGKRTLGSVGTLARARRVGLFSADWELQRGAESESLSPRVIELHLA